MWVRVLRYNSFVQKNVIDDHENSIPAVFVVRCLTWVPGKDASQAKTSRDLISSSALLLAQVHEAVEGKSVVLFCFSSTKNLEFNHKTFS